MKIQQITPQILNNKDKYNNNDVQFGGFFETASAGLRFLDTNQAWGANAVDLSSMVIPRTTVDFVNRGPEAGVETARREATGTANHSLVGVYGTLSGMLLALLLNKKYGVRADKIFADNNTIEIISKYWSGARSLSDDKSVYVKKFTDKILDNIKFFNTDSNKADGLIKLSSETREKVSNALAQRLLNSNDKTIDKKFAEYIRTLITSDTGAETKVILTDGAKNADNTLKTLINNIYNVSKTFMEDSIDQLFKTSKDNNEFIQCLKKLNIKRSVAGLGIGALIGMSTQPINMYLTKKKTGQDGFVGVPGREKDKTKGFKILKTIAAIAFATGALSTITTNPSKFLSKIQFQGMTPTLNQLKLVYGLTISSRLLSARDKDELRESTVKDTLGFLNLLVLGALVTKGAARLMDKSLVNVTKEGSKNFFKWLGNSSLKTRDEILLSSLKGKNIDTVKDGKAISFKTLAKLADEPTKLKLLKLNIAQIIGYLYSGLVLGVGIPKLNIYMTNKSEAKRKAKLAAQSVNDDKNLMLKPENIAFLRNNI